MKLRLFLIIIVMFIFVAGCQASTPVCQPPTGTPIYLHTSPSELATPTPAIGSYDVLVGSTNLKVDKIVEGPLCNDTWRGTVYVKCDVQVYPWTEEPVFLKDCQLNIEPHTVVYVAYHNNTAYYNGCSCHTGITPTP